ncbi:phosphate ABC transporter permease subunit PstC [Brevibacillus sp. HB1.2]|uniref:Phosphate transport system permease protein n=1 Tax=Brevibacillus porteri TaxID=2126350 RepID=A0ABX5FQJ3_9BACL|nr:MULTISPECIES: phosphate ABC transporter permease subunit PstC [Brevibacillus]ATF10992.1 phosphate ABC transporter permease subunit PstC [Brevibacillus brevis X23]MDC0764431.1 phosphate ABC transporter permease subunit PstC [Brevibacillus sp. AG]MED1797117.1 phosphate ABC transporter permease subunit PstC [Brevibacillus porteri]MED2129870.1 phosphate ABC transporter permease subunit PstC [Brevibacillus porteri]MED2746277.1 phosphate ABC transporter permease subunit PstC [Brevibacillus porter
MSHRTEGVNTERKSMIAQKMLTTNKRQKTENITGKTIAMICAGLLVIVVLSITYFIASKGLSTFFVDGVSFKEFLTHDKWDPEGEPSAYGVLPFILGSFFVTALAALIAAPLGIGAAIFMTEIFPGFGKKVLKPVIELLVGIPSVVYGYVGLTLLVPFIREQFDVLGFSLLAGGLVLALMILPTITSVAADAIEAVPQDLRNASLALGATRWQTIWNVVLHSALPGCLTAIVLGMSRAFGEALAVQMVIGNTTKLPGGLFEPISTLTSGITLNMGNTIQGTPYNNALWSMALLLLAMSFIFIVILRLLGRKRLAK